MSEFYSAIDIGSTLTRVVVARYGEDGVAEIIGVGSAPSRGVRAGNIVNIEATIQSIQEACREAELMSGMVVESALVNITGKHLHGDNSRGVVAITNKNRVVTEADVLRVIEGAQNIRIPADQEVIHVLSREFTVDDQGGMKDPVGITGVRLEADVHIVTASVTALSNLNKTVTGAGIQITDGVMSSLASAEAVLETGERDLGVAVIDIGGGICDIIVYLDGGVYYSSVVPLGGIHVTQDLSIGLKVPVDSAEMVKKSYGSALMSLVDPVEKVDIPGVPGRPQGRTVLRQDVAVIIEARMREIFELADAELLRSGKKNALAGGVVLTGGASMLDGCAALAEEVIGLSVRSGRPTMISGFAERAGGPEFSTAVGLVHYAGRLAAGQNMGHQAEKHAISDSGSMIAKIKHWISENL